MYSLPSNHHLKFLTRYAFEHFPIGSNVTCMSCGGGHRGFPIGIKNIHFVEDFPMIIPGQYEIQNGG